MSEKHYLNAGYKDREMVKALGARWDPDRKRWYVPAGLDLTPFAAWLPAALLRSDEEPSTQPPTAAPGPLAPTGALDLSNRAIARHAAMSSEVALSPVRDSAVVSQGVSLSQLLAQVAQAVAQTCPAGQWVRVEVVKADVRRGHVYLELAERSPGGDVIAQARAVIWAKTANQIVPAFEQATGVVLGAGIKLLLRARPNFSPQYGLSLVIEAIDPGYTLGDLEARKREIRAQLQREGLFERNRSLPAAWDYNAVLVVAPESAAGLGDFLAEAQRLQRWGVCRFVVAHSRFQGEGAAAEVAQALGQAIASWAQRVVELGLEQELPDAVVIIRGGGSANDLAWLNHYGLARALCELPVPVLVGIGHERDSTVLDEVAHTSYDTPSKVIAGIEQAIVKRAREAKAHHDQIIRLSEQAVRRERQAVEQGHALVRTGAQKALSQARERATRAFQAVRHDGLLKIEQARHAVPATMAQIASLARQTRHEARRGAAAHRDSILERAAQRVVLAGERARSSLEQVTQAARRQLQDARAGAQATMREIAGQGPDKTLGRGFALVRGLDGRPITSAAGAREAPDLQIEFRDGQVPARVGRIQE